MKDNNSPIAQAALLIFCLSLLISCTSSPLGEENIGFGKRRIHGTVHLSDGGSPDSVYVWLRNQDLSTYTDADGDFEFVLPQQPSRAGGTIGEDEVYFYLANYLIHRAAVMIRDGEFMYDRGDIGKDGSFSRRIVMQRFLRIITRVMPDIIAMDDSISVRVETELIAEDQCVEVFIPNSPPTSPPHNGPLGAVILRNVDTGALFLAQQPVDTFDQIAVCESGVTRTILLYFPAGLFALGTYEIIPYLWINPPGITQELAQRASTPFQQLSPAYLSKPMKRKDGLLEVRTESPY